jgi:hypothetical protein
MGFAIQEYMETTPRERLLGRLRGEGRAVCRYHDDQLRFTAAIRQAWILATTDEPSAGGLRRPARDVFVQALTMYGFDAHIAARAWLGYDGFPGPDARANAIRTLEEELLEVAAAQGRCGRRVTRRA